MNEDFQTHSQSRQPLTLWLAEDDDGVRELLAEFFDRSGRVQCARQFACAEEVVSALRAGPAPEVILLDVNMGELDGIEAIAPIRRLASHARVFIMTTFHDTMTLSRARHAGASGFFLKRDDWDESIARMLDVTMDWVKEAPLTEEARPEKRTPARGLALSEAWPA
jgi:DNA-binding NarL/FixJ family response regulator